MTISAAALLRFPPTTAPPRFVHHFPQPVVEAVHEGDVDVRGQSERNQRPRRGPPHGGNIAHVDGRDLAAQLVRGNGTSQEMDVFDLDVASRKQIVPPARIEHRDVRRRCPQSRRPAPRGADRRSCGSIQIHPTRSHRMGAHAFRSFLEDGDPPSLSGPAEREKKGQSTLRASFLVHGESFDVRGLLTAGRPDRVDPPAHHTARLEA